MAEPISVAIDLDNCKIGMKGLSNME